MSSIGQHGQIVQERVLAVFAAYKAQTHSSEEVSALLTVAHYLMTIQSAISTK